MTFTVQLQDKGAPEERLPRRDDWVYIGDKVVYGKNGVGEVTGFPNLGEVKVLWGSGREATFPRVSLHRINNREATWRLGNYP